MTDKKELTREKYNQEEFERLKRQIAAKKGLVTKAQNVLEGIKNELNGIGVEYSKAGADIKKAEKAYQDSAQYEAYLLAQAKTSEAYKSLEMTQNKLYALEIQYKQVLEKVKNAEEAYHKQQEELENAEEAFQDYKEKYEIVTNPIAYSEILREEIADRRKNLDQVRSEMQNWSRLTRAASVVGLVIFTIAVIFALTQPSRFDLVAVSGLLGGAIAVGLNRVFHGQYNDAKKRFDKNNEEVSRLQREILGLSTTVDSKSSETQGNK